MRSNVLILVFIVGTIWYELYFRRVYFCFLIRKLKPAERKIFSAVRCSENRIAAARSLQRLSSSICTEDKWMKMKWSQFYLRNRPGLISRVKTLSTYKINPRIILQRWNIYMRAKETTNCSRTDCHQFLSHVYLSDCNARNVSTWQNYTWEVMWKCLGHAYIMNVSY